MIKNILKIFAFFSVALASGACQTSGPADTSIRAQEWQPQINMPVSVVVCRSKQCAPARLSMSKEYIYNSLMHLLENNNNEKALICQADPFAHVCTEDYVTLPITVGVTPANLYINDVEIADTSIALNRKSIDLLLNYGVSYNGQTPTCKPAKSLIYVKNTQNIVLEDSGYMCKMTTIGNTTIKTLFAIDYIDLDYGFVGGYYSIGLSGPAYGGRSGYMMIKFKNDAYPLSPDLILKEQSANTRQNAIESVFPADECYSVALEPMPCYEETPCFEDINLGKVICPQPQSPEFMIYEQSGAPIYRSYGVSRPKTQGTVKNQAPKNTKNIASVKSESTAVSVYDPPVSEEIKGTDYNGVEVFPIYQKKK